MYFTFWWYYMKLAMDTWKPGKLKVWKMFAISIGGHVDVWLNHGPISNMSFILSLQKSILHRYILTLNRLMSIIKRTVSTLPPTPVTTTRSLWSSAPDLAHNRPRSSFAVAYVRGILLPITLWRCHAVRRDVFFFFAPFQTRIAPWNIHAQLQLGFTFCLGGV